RRNGPALSDRDRSRRGGPGGARALPHAARRAGEALRNRPRRRPLRPFLRAQRRGRHALRSRLAPPRGIRLSLPGIRLMASVVLNVVGGAIAGPIGAAVGSIIGAVIDSRIVAALTPTQRIEGRRLEDVR